MSDSFKKELLFDLGLLLLIAAVFLGGFAYFRLEFGRFAEKRSALSPDAMPTGPWAEQGASGRPLRRKRLYAAAGRAVYAHGALLHPLARTWRAFAVVCGPSYSLWFDDPWRRRAGVRE